LAKKRIKPNTSVTWAQAVRDILIGSMNKGQLPILAAFAIVFLIILKMPEEDVSTLAFDIFDSIKKGYLLGYILFIITLLTSFFSFKYLRKSYSYEYKRIGREKSELQKKITGIDFESSEDK